MRILHVDTGREMRGGQWQVLYLCDGLRNAGHQVDLLTPQGSPLAAAAGKAGLQVRAGGLAALARLSGRADVVHAHDARAHTLAALTSLRPVVVSRRVAFPVKRGWLSRWKYKRPAHFIAVSRHVRGQLEAAGVPEAKVTVVYDGVPALDPAGGGARVVALRTNDPRKGSDLLRGAAGVAGVDIHWSTALVSDLPDAGVFVYITESEGLGSAALLALSAGVPVIASRTGGLPEIVEDGVTGLLVENDVGAIATAMRRLISDAELRRRLADAGRARVRDKFSIDEMVRGTAAVYDRVLTC